MIVYILMKKSKIKDGLIYKLKMKLKQKLFYSSVLRYMIVSNLKLNYTVWAFLLLAAQSDSTFTNKLKLGSLLLTVFGLLILPLFVLLFMIKNQKRTNKPEFAQEWDALYKGFNTEQLGCLFYHAVFCTRRFHIVFINMIFSPGFPLTNFDQHQYLLKNFFFIFI